MDYGSKNNVLFSFSEKISKITISRKNISYSEKISKITISKKIFFYFLNHKK